MNYESIAKQVHELVKNPKSMLSPEHRLSEREVENNELTIIQSVFTKYEVTGDALTLRITPLDLWG